MKMWFLCVAVSGLLGMADAAYASPPSYFPSYLLLRRAAILTEPRGTMRIQHTAFRCSARLFLRLFRSRTPPSPRDPSWLLRQLSKSPLECQRHQPRTRTGPPSVGASVLGSTASPSYTPATSPRACLVGESDWQLQPRSRSQPSFTPTQRRSHGVRFERIAGYRVKPRKKLKFWTSSKSALATGKARSRASGAGPNAGMAIRTPKPGATRY